MNAAAQEAGHPAPIISVHGLADRKACAVFGLDLSSWAKQGLIDRVVASSWGVEFGSKTTQTKWPSLDLNYYAECVAGTGVELWAGVPRPPADADFADHYGRRVEFLYGNRVQGLYFWDAHQRRRQPDHFAVLSVLGHKKDLKRQVAAARGKSRVVELKRLLGMDLAKSRFPAWLSG